MSSKNKKKNVDGAGKQLGIKIVCHGVYFYKHGETKGAKDYADLVVRAPSMEYFRETSSRYTGTELNEQGLSVPKFSERSFINIRGQLKKRLLPIMLRNKYQDFVRVKFVVIDEIISEKGEPLDLPIQLQSMKQLAEYVKANRIPLDTDTYLEIDGLRTDILEYNTDPIFFKHTQKRRDSRRKEEQQFIQMNDLGTTLPPLKRETQYTKTTPTASPVVPPVTGIEDL